MPAMSTHTFLHLCHAGICDRCGGWGVTIRLALAPPEIDWSVPVLDFVVPVRLKTVELCDWCQLAWSWGLRELRS